MKSRDWVWLGAGVAIGAGLNQVIPPALGLLRGALIAGMGDDPFGEQILAHRAVLAALDDVELAEPADRPRFLEKLAVVARRHTAVDGDELGLHQAIEDLITADGSDRWVGLLDALYQRVQAHAREQEEVTFPGLRARAAESLDGSIPA